MIIPNTSDLSNPLYVNRNVDDASNPTTLTISNASTLGLTGTHTAEVRSLQCGGGMLSATEHHFHPATGSNSLRIHAESPGIGRSEQRLDRALRCHQRLRGCRLLSGNL